MIRYGPEDHHLYRVADDFSSQLEKKLVNYRVAVVAAIFQYRRVESRVRGSSDAEHGAEDEELDHSENDGRDGVGARAHDGVAAALEAA